MHAMHATRPFTFSLLALVSMLPSDRPTLGFTAVFLWPLLDAAQRRDGRIEMNQISGHFPLNAELNPICHLLVLLDHHIFHVSGLRVNFRLVNPHNLAVLRKVRAAHSFIHLFTPFIHSFIHSIHCLVTGPYWLIPWSRLLPEKLTGP